MFRLLSILTAAAGLSALFAGCSRGAPASRPAGHRIVSFSPGLTSILFDMGLGDEVVGVTRYCMLPPGVTRPALGDRQNLTGEALLQLDPDMIFVQQDPQQFEELRKFKPDLRIEHFTLERLADIPVAMSRIGELASRADLAHAAVERFTAALHDVTQKVHGLPAPSVIFVMGYERPVVAGSDTFVSDMIDAAGGKSVGDLIQGYTRWRDAGVEGILKAAPEVLICQVDPGQEVPARDFWMSLSDLPAAKRKAVFIVTDRRWTIPGAFLPELTKQLAAMVHPEAFASSQPNVGASYLIARVEARPVMTQANPQPAPAADSASQDVTARKLLIWAAAGAAATVVVLGACSLAGEYRTTAGVWQLRVYRLLTSAAVGAALASAGMALQGLLRNPLADPYILGISSGAGVGVLAGLAVSARQVLPEWASQPVLAFLGAMAACTVVYGIAQRRGRLDPYSLILSGVIVNIFNGAVMLTAYLFIDPYRISDFARWSMGQIPEGAETRLLFICCACVLIGWLLIFLQAPALNALALGDEVAASSGVAVHRLRVTTFVLTGIVTAAAVALAGPIGFVGLIVPHICRMLVGPDHRKLLIVSGFVGSIFLMLADTLCHTVGPLLGVNKVPVGIVTALCGGPFFIYLLRRRLRETPV